MSFLLEIFNNRAHFFFLPLFISSDSLKAFGHLEGQMD